VILLHCSRDQIESNRCDPPDLESALLVVKSIRTNEIEPETDTGGNSVAAEALKHLMLYVDTSELYRISLGLYDLSLAYMVVINSQVSLGHIRERY